MVARLQANVITSINYENTSCLEDYSRATLALLQIYKQFCLYCKHINVETQKSNVAALGGNVQILFWCMMHVRCKSKCTLLQLQRYAVLAHLWGSLGLQLYNITSLAIDLPLRARPVKKVTVTCFIGNYLTQCGSITAAATGWWWCRRTRIVQRHDPHPMTMTSHTQHPSRQSTDPTDGPTWSTGWSTLGWIEHRHIHVNDITIHQ